MKENIDVGNIVIKQSTTGEILAYYFTKPLQGTLFKNFRLEIKGIPTKMDDREMVWYVSRNLMYSQKRTIQPWKNPAHGSVLGNILIMIFQNRPFQIWEA